MEDILKEERLRKGREALENATLAYIESRAKAFKTNDVELLKEKLRKIKELSISNLDHLVDRAIERLTDQGINVHVARDSEEACGLALELIPKGEKVVKSKSNVIHEIGLLKKLEGRNRVVETDCGDFIIRICDEEPAHPVTPAIHLAPTIIAQKIMEKFGEAVEGDPTAITEWVRRRVREEVMTASVGLTGANVISSDGSIFIVENEGNISLVSRIPEKHLIITGIDKVVPTVEDAIMICKALGIWGTGANMPSYVNVISRPSLTADVAKKIVLGVHGPKEIHLILVDNGRRKMIEEGLSEILYCINCGSCLYFCPVYRQLLNNFGSVYFGGIGVARAFFNASPEIAFESGLYFCTTCGACRTQCPLSIDVPDIIRKLRSLSVIQGLVPESAVEMARRIEEFGDPYGGEGVEKEKWYCC